MSVDVRGVPVDPRFAAAFARVCPSGIAVLYELREHGIERVEVTLPELWEIYLRYVERDQAHAVRLLECLGFGRGSMLGAVPPAATPSAETAATAPVGVPSWKPRVVK